MSGGLRSRPGPVELLLFPSTGMLSDNTSDSFSTLCTSVSGVSSTEIDFKLKLSSLQNILSHIRRDASLTGLTWKGWWRKQPDCRSLKIRGRENCQGVHWSLLKAVLEPPAPARSHRCGRQGGCC